MDINMSPQGATIRHPYPQGCISTQTIMVFKWLEEVQGLVDEIYSPLCVVLYKEQYVFIVPWSVTDPYTNINWFSCSKKDNDWILPEGLYNKELKNFQVPIHNGSFLSQTFKENSNTEDTCTNYSGSDKFNVITREGNL